MSSIGTKFVLAQQFVFDPNNNSLINKFNDNELNRLGSNESRILLLFSERPNQIITRDELHEFVWREQGFQVDDSSLTQAISTLRKMLIDSTKAPRFVKTVPKRGYQFIASVEKTIPLSSSEEKSTQQNKAERETPSEMTKKNAHIDSMETKNKTPMVDANITCAKKKQSNTFTTLIFLVAILLPIIVFMTTEPTPTQFKLIDTIEDVPLLTTENHPPLNDWQPLMNKCVSTYLAEHTQKPIKIIVTAGPNNNLILNYVHSKPNSTENITIQLIAKQQEMSALCKD